MGALHDGHLSLLRAARAECDVVVMSLFVNPAQFNEAADLDAYPRDEARDARLAEAAGVDLLFAPSAQEMYPSGFSTSVHVSGVSEPLEGAHRGAGHFDGVATVVTKLLNIVGPEVAYFGQKDAQQVLVIRRLVADLNLPVRIAVLPTVREPDGLARSSRNVRLSGEQRIRARSLSRALALLRDGGSLADAQQLLAESGVDTEYLELVDPETLAPLPHPGHRPALALVAARIGAVRLIDNQTLET
jgi:pantoate--beta-alanine ligase